MSAFAHRGHPSHAEQLAADRLRARLGVLLVQLEPQGFTHDEAVAFVAGCAYEVGIQNGETWHDTSTAKETIANVLAGAAAKQWSIATTLTAIKHIEEML